MGWLDELLRGFGEGTIAEKLGPDFRMKQQAAQSELQNDESRRGLLGVQTDAARLGMDTERLNQEKARQGIAEGELTRSELARLAETGALPSASREASDVVSTVGQRTAATRGAEASTAQTLAETAGMATPDEARRLRQATMAKIVADAQESQAKAAAAGDARAKGTLIPVTDQQGRITGFFNNKTGDTRGLDGQPIRGEMRKGGLSAAENTARSSLETMLTDISTLRGVAGRSKGSIGTIDGRIAAFQRATGMQSDSPETRDTNDLFHISDNLADQLLRARSGAQINEREYIRLRSLVPDPRAGEAKFFADLDRMEIELKNALSARQGGDPAAGLAVEGAPAGGEEVWTRGPDGRPMRVNR